MNIEHLRDERVLPANVADVGVTREHSRQRRLYGLLLVGAVVGVWLWVSVLVRHLLGTPHLTHSEAQVLPLVALVILVGAVMVVPLVAAGRSPHIRYRPEEIDIARAREAKQRAEERLNSVNPEIDYSRAGDALQRAECRIVVAGKK